MRIEAILMYKNRIFRELRKKQDAMPQVKGFVRMQAPVSNKPDIPELRDFINSQELPRSGNQADHTYCWKKFFLALEHKLRSI